MPAQKFKLTEKVKQFRLTVFLHFLCERVGIKHNGRQMELYFEPAYMQENKAQGSNRRSCKYDRYFEGKNPSDKTVKIITEKVMGAAGLFYSPLWQVLSLAEQGQSSFDDFLQTLPLDVLQIIYEPEPGFETEWQRRTITAKRLNKIIAISRLDALACVLALMFEENDEHLRVPIEGLETAIWVILNHSLTQQLYYPIGKQLHDFLADFLTNNRH